MCVSSLDILDGCWHKEAPEMLSAAPPGDEMEAEGASQ